jgi:NAD(P)-dependent dehydrogenase (short-subunit alcohol dehydrogenase family)
MESQPLCDPELNGRSSRSENGGEMNGSVALVTGANRGLGFGIARRVGETGATVLVGARDPNRGAAAANALSAAGLKAIFVRLDVTEITTIAAAARMIEERFGRLDILINNAAISTEVDVPPSLAPLADVRRVFDTNFFGVIAVARAMVPLLRKSEHGRIVNISGALGSLTLHSNPDWEFRKLNILGYNASKTALNAFTVFLANELRDTPIKVNSVSPGSVRTDLNKAGAMDPYDAAEALMWLATLPSDGPTGGFFRGRDVIPW